MTVRVPDAAMPPHTYVLDLEVHPAREDTREAIKVINPPVAHPWRTGALTPKYDLDQSIQGGIRVARLTAWQATGSLTPLPGGSNDSK
jgi:hypothetical protein